ncbi:protoheme IX farnesyltransferase [Roseivirga ehrenbergii]|uniref:Protoheme IX farnesyltransferase n=1 Tax=Roseivirga ehrenbergii (strain DSM 102268 / JCM 13514 / KCTC 12282 / NCIMB 14502 / KMM 6017) TaxID=279360 RepID=A0A150X6M7_ROSEK|nr:heme o synthase [Roseivirga ehrenbergii]KYG74350.1 protoheme IX farnesyltransferase [Roseivirga ehrenbergii]TCL14352.1 protoheme IX farnesyltransferase [Roseivirga ehrenbergii]
MISGSSANIGVGELIAQKAKAYLELVKMRLSLLVAFSSAFGYTLAMGGNVDWTQLILLFIGGFLVSGASCTVNQVTEKEYDAMMKRTQNRPLPTNRLTKNEALTFAAIVAVMGILVLYFSTNLLTTGLAILSMVLYSFVYTPLKRVGPIAVFVGAFPGALPPLLGWVAATGAISHEAMIIFGIQFIWQFPHFWAIAWVADEDYKKAGFKLLPVKGEKDMKTAFQIMTYTLFLIPLGLLPTYFGITGVNSGVVATICGVLFLAQTIKLMRDQSRKSALRIMFGSFLYLPIVQIAYLLDMVK